MVWFYKIFFHLTLSIQRYVVVLASKGFDYHGTIARGQFYSAKLSPQPPPPSSAFLEILSNDNFGLTEGCPDWGSCQHIFLFGTNAGTGTLATQGFQLPVTHFTDTIRLVTPDSLDCIASACPSKTSNGPPHRTAPYGKRFLRAVMLPLRPIRDALSSAVIWMPAVTYGRLWGASDSSTSDGRLDLSMRPY
jgi:hypothetical protein